MTDAVRGRAEIGHDVIAFLVERASDDDPFGFVTGVKQAGVVGGGGLGLIGGQGVGARTDITVLGLQANGWQQAVQTEHAEREK